MKMGKVFFAIIGLIEEAGKQLAELGDEIVERGRLLSEKNGDASEKLIDKALGSPRDAAKIAGDILRDAFDNIGLATPGDIENLRGRLSQIEKSLAAMKKAGRAPGNKNDG
jgi:polyhydroxyalkanoate synthesis regulator phasin